MGKFLGFGKSNVAYFPGCATYHKYRDFFGLYQKIFLKLGIDFELVEKKVCSGLPAFEAGYEKEARKIARRNFEIFKEAGIKSIITNSPGAYVMFLENYSELLPDWDLEIRNLWEVIAEKLAKKSRLIKFKAMEMITFHDSCYLARYSHIYEEPRQILELIGYQIVEMSDNKMNTMCCGSCGGLRYSNPKLADEIAKERIVQAKRLGVKKMIVASVDNYDLLKKNAVGSEIEILELSEVLALALGIKKEEIVREEAIDGEDEVIKGKNLKEEINDEESIEDVDWSK
ncbi:(Fe-S)-binding protein [Candidatus Pacearchaeota archaeon]|nr:(Fe-S)-binding protein [Candidatus Pacearchaeota archaeon]